MPRQSESSKAIFPFWGGYFSLNLTSKWIKENASYSNCKKKEGEKKRGN